MDVRETKFTVKQSRPGRWSVCEAGFEKPLAEFADRDEAIDYARAIAATKPRASLDAEGDNGSTAVHENFELETSTHKQL